jgi:hypothetical protein
VDAYFAMCANASSAEGDEDKPEENGAGEFLVCFFCHCQIWLSLV